MRALLFIVAASMGVAVAADAPSVDYPEGYRDWTHVKSMILNPGHPLYDSFGGIHHIYANEKAMEGYRTGRFPDGSVLVFDLLEANAADNAVTEGKRKVLGVMQKDRAKFAATGGWGYEGFEGGDKTKRVVGAKAAEACHACHQAQAKQDFVFSSYRE
ncbi:MAG TPA: cytochrome P460 family protein [Steroidobacteraceae bacterium]|jgi:hypothetical protein